MSDTCHCHDNYVKDVLIPQVGVITDIREETPDVKTFRVNAPEGGKLFEHMPGQCAMLCAPGVSEGMFPSPLADEQRIPGIQHQEVRSAYRLPAQP